MENKTKNEFKFTVYENIKNGARTCSAYNKGEAPEGLKIVDHTKTLKEAQALCDVNRNQTMNAYIANSLKRFLGGLE